jgi:hypothetical protein
MQFVLVVVYHGTYPVPGTPEAERVSGRPGGPRPLQLHRLHRDLLRGRPAR